MTAAETRTDGAVAGSGLLDRERIVARPGFNRWLVPPAALAIHLCIGMAYGFSVFWLPLSKSLGITASTACPDLTLASALFTTTCDWRVADLGWIYTLFFVLLGSSAAIWGGWLERAGPRKAGVVSACCWCGGIVLAAVGVITHQLWLMWLGAGVIGGIGLGLGYISPVSTLIKWFPDRRGMATGMAIMGFGGGAMIGAPLANLLMNAFKTDTSVGVWQTFIVMAAIYFVFMMGGAFGYRIPPAGWRPEGWTPPAAKSTMITTKHVHLRDAHKTKQFWLIWAVLCLNVSAGIGVIGMASPMLQEIFAGSLIGLPDVGFAQLDAGQKASIATIAAGFAGLLSLFNIGGRFFWASLSDKIGRKNTYYSFFIIGIVLYALAPTFAGIGNKALFVLAFGIILSMYGGGFATIPAYLADIFGTQFVGAIHGRLLTAWATAGIVGPVVVNYIREAQIVAGVAPGPTLYTGTMYILAGMLALGLIANAFVRPLPDKWFMRDDEVAALQAKSAAVNAGPTGSFGIGTGRARRQGGASLGGRRHSAALGCMGDAAGDLRAVRITDRSAPRRYPTARFILVLRRNCRNRFYRMRVVQRDAAWDQNSSQLSVPAAAAPCVLTTRETRCRAGEPAGDGVKNVLPHPKIGRAQIKNRPDGRFSVGEFCWPIRLPGRPFRFP